MEHTGYKKEPSEDALYAYFIMTIIQGIQQRPLHHDYKQTKALQWLQQTVFKLVWQIKMLKVVHGNQCNRSDTQPSIPLLYIIQYYSSTRKHPKLSHPCLACTLWLCCAWKLLLLFLGTSQTKSQPTVWPIADFLLIYMLILTSILPVNANPDYITIIMPAHQ